MSAALLEIAPGQLHRAPAPSLPGAAEAGPRYLLAELVPVGGGLYRLQHRPMLEWVAVGSESLSRLGITCSESTMHRLGRAGFIRFRPISPSRYEFSLRSWLEHCARVEADPEEFWDRREPAPGGPTRREKYSQAL